MILLRFRRLFHSLFFLVVDRYELPIHKVDWLKSIQHVVIKLTGGIVSSNLDHLSIRPMSCVTGLIVTGVTM